MGNVFQLVIIQHLYLFYLNHTHNGIQYYIIINDNNRLIYIHGITLINSNIINDIVNIIITKTINIQIV